MYSAQLLPCIVIGTIFIVNLVKKRMLVCVSSLVLFYDFLAMVGAVYVSTNPRSGETFVSFRAMVYLMFFYGAICLPAIFFKDGVRKDDIKNLNCLQAAHEDVYIRFCRFIAILTFPAFIYFFFDALPHFREFIGGSIDRESFRASVDLSHFSSPAMMIFALFGTLSLASSFLGVMTLVFFPTHIKLGTLLICGGFTYAMNMLKHAGRAGTFEALVFILTVGLVLWPRIDFQTKKILRRGLVVFAFLVLVPFSLITVTRFGEADPTDRGVLYSLITYFSTGPYSFNVHHEVFSEYDMSRGYGVITCALLTKLVDVLGGTNYSEYGQLFLEDISEGMPEYAEVSGAFSGEFTTVVGTFVTEFGLFWAGVILISLVALFIFCFRRGSRSFLGVAMSVVYFYSLFLGPIGFGFATRYRNLMLFNLLLVAFLVDRILSRQNQRTEENKGEWQ